MRRFYNLPGILSLSDEEKELIRQQALEGDPVACYKLAEIFCTFMSARTMCLLHVNFCRRLAKVALQMQMPPWH